MGTRLTGFLKLTSPVFPDGGEIPRGCGYKDGNCIPPLTISGLHEGIKSMAIIMDDPDAMAAVGKVWVHWVVWNIVPGHFFGKRLWKKARNYYKDGDTIEDIYFAKDHLVVEYDAGINDFGDMGYGGPAPPDKRHTYVFKLYALDSKLDLPDKSTKADVEKAMKGHIIEQTQLTGTYAPSGGICTLERKIEDDMNWHVVEDVFDSTGEKIGERDHW